MLAQPAAEGGQECKHGRAVAWFQQGQACDETVEDIGNPGRAAAMQARGRAVDSGKAADNKRRFDEVHQFSVSRSVPRVTSMLAQKSLITFQEPLDCLMH